MTSESLRHAIAGEADRELESEMVAVGSIVHELDIELVLLVEREKDSLSLAMRESDHEFVRETVRGRLDVTVEERVPVKVALSVASRLAVSDEMKV